MATAMAARGMNSLDAIATEPSAAPLVWRVRLPMGLLGFEEIKDYLLIANPGEEPFRWLQVEANATLSFIVVEPFLVLPDYHPDIPEPDADFLELGSPADALVLNIVTLHGPNRATMNLKGPVVLNRHKLFGKQVVIRNAADYSVQHPLPLNEAGS